MPKIDGGIFVTVLLATMVGLALHQGVIAPQIAKMKKQ